MLGVNSRTTGILSYLTGKFGKYAVYKMPTAAETSREWYIICANYDPNRAPRSNVFFSRMTQLIEYELVDAALRSLSLLKRDKAKEPKVTERSDWFRPDSIVQVESYQLSETSTELGEKYSFSVTTGEDFDYDWKTNPQACLDTILHTLGRTKYSMRPRTIPSSRPWKHIIGLGRYGTKGSAKQRVKHTANGLISTYMKSIAGWTPANGTYGWTQSTPEFSDRSYTERLDRSAGKPGELYMQHLVECCDTMATEAGQQLFGKCTFASKERVLASLNNKGATGRFCKQANLKQWIEANPDWYEQGLAVIEMWNRGERTGTYWTVRNKVETKQRKDVDSDFKIVTEGTYGELLNAGDMVPRQITFADEATRIAHYILLGDLLEHNTQQKVYYGSCNGLPLFRVGTAMRMLWDAQSPPTAKKLARPYDKNSEVGYVGDENENEPEGAMACSMDYSKFDFSQTVFDRMNECRFVKKFFPPQYHNIIDNCFKEMAFRVMFNDFGDIWFLQGMRASGELMTSFLNSFQASLHFRAALAKCLSLPLQRINTTVGMLEVDWKNNHKRYEVTPYMNIWDGDDGVCFFTTKIRSKLENLDMYLKFGGKTMRSGAKSGVKFCRKFGDVDFCSHSYYPILIGEGVTALRHGNVWSNPIKYARENNIRVWWLPDTHDALIAVSLAKLSFR